MHPTKEHTPSRGVLKVIHLVMTSGLILFSAVTFLIVPKRQGSPFLDLESDGLMMIIAGLVVIAGFILSELFSKKLAFPKDGTESEVLSWLQTRHIIRIAPIEGAGLFCAVQFLQTSNLAFILLVAIVVLRLLTLFPTETRIDNWIFNAREKSNRQ